MNTDTVIVGIFDDSQNLERADKQLAAAGFEATVHDSATMAEESCTVNPVPIGSVLAPGAPTEEVGDSKLSVAVSALKSHLADCQLPDEAVDSYANTFSHHGKLVVVRTEPECAKHVIGILEACGASRVNRHELETLV